MHIFPPARHHSADSLFLCWRHLLGRLLAVALDLQVHVLLVGAVEVGAIIVVQVAHLLFARGGSPDAAGIFQLSQQLALM